jgi:SAM-dependent methyltransferase/GNAT superfamily N-acetyltransferase
MITIIRTDSDNEDFIELVKYLDADLAEKDGDDHLFYAQLNKTDKIRHVVVAYENDKPVGCGAIRAYIDGIMEVKRMYTAPGSRGKGIATKVLAELEIWATELSYGKCILETGKRQPEAIALYKKNGYKRIPNYGKYAGVENSVCFGKEMALTMINKTEKPEFWESSFIEKQEMWGFEPSNSAVLTKDFFVKKTVKNILIPGIGYGRNAQIFRENGITVTGIEISKTAIELARKHYGTDMTIYHGPITDMPFDNCRYDGIFCYALIHLLDGSEREKLISECYNQLSEGGYMVFTAISKEAHTYEKGKFLSKDRYEIFAGVKLFFYDRESIHAEFDKAGLFEIMDVNENYPFFLIKCRKGEANN